MSKALPGFCGIPTCLCLVVAKLWLLAKFIRCNVCATSLEILAGSIKIPSYNPAFGDSGILQQPLLYHFM